VLRAHLRGNLDRLTQLGAILRGRQQGPARDCSLPTGSARVTKVVASSSRSAARRARGAFDYLAMLMSARTRRSGAPMGERELIDEA